MKSYRCTWIHMPDVAAYYAAETAGKARYLCFLTLQDVRRDARLIDICTTRAPEHDTLARERIRPGYLTIPEETAQCLMT
jgi:hypothetical protein